MPRFMKYLQQFSCNPIHFSTRQFVANSMNFWHALHNNQELDFHMYFPETFAFNWATRQTEQESHTQKLWFGHFHEIHEKLLITFPILMFWAAFVDVRYFQARGVSRKLTCCTISPIEKKTKQQCKELIDFGRWLILLEHFIRAYCVIV